MVTRKSAEDKVYGREQKASAEIAIRIRPRGRAAASFEEDIKGSIEVDKLADSVILWQDPTRSASNRIKDITVEKTYVGGKLAFARQ